MVSMAKVVADLHLHSKYSRAVSQEMNLITLDKWARLKGINLVGSADFTHPLWFRELQANLLEVNSGIFKLKGSSFPNPVYFLISGEISSIYIQNNQPRRIHNLLLMPSLEIAKKVNQKLQDQGANLLSDGRPITGLSSQQLCELVWSIDKNVLVIPAHCWTPWYSLYGSKSGFDSIEECYGQFAQNIYGVETGLSSNPEMNWRIPELDRLSILSFSDAHSPAKLGREATVFQLKDNFSFNDLSEAIQNTQKTESLKSKKSSLSDNLDLSDKSPTFNFSENKILYTIEFYPEEGKYHYTGHRLCGISQSPDETNKKGTICPVCGKCLTVGVMHRVQQLAKNRLIKTVKKENSSQLAVYYNQDNPRRPPYIMLVPLMEIIAEAKESNPASRKVRETFFSLTSRFPEFDWLTKLPLKEISLSAGDKISQGIQKVRQGDIFIQPGFDGVFGTVKIWQKNQEKTTIEKEQMSLF
jgi:PHP family Zn ribbon phosphoesterase